MAFIPDDHLPNLASYQFKSTGYSYLDKFLSKFLWEPLVTTFPSWLAPNVITVIGLVFMLCSYLIMLPYDDSFTKPIPTNLLYISAFCQFMYQTLDACDGKQARKLKLASPLGMLMDHGCDAISCTFMILATAQGMNMGINRDSMLLLMVVYTGFFLTMWEEYHTHYHRTHMFNWGVTEGQWTSIVILALTGAYSATLWENEYYGYTLRSLLIYANVTIGTAVSVLMIAKTLASCEGILPVMRLVPMVMQNVSLYFWFQSDLIGKFAPSILIIHGLIFAEINSKMIICSTAQMKFRWFHLNAFLELALVLEMYFVKELPQITSFYVFSLIIVSWYSSFVCGVVMQLACFLDISVFKVKTN